jgi:predicted kinase
MSTIDQNHIRKELVRLSKMARELRMKELAHFIDVAGEVAAETNSKAERSKATRH